MKFQPSLKTAAVAGAWFGLWISLSGSWMDARPGLSELQSNLLHLASALFFFLLPAYFLVIGRSRPLKSEGVFSAKESSRQMVVAKRMLVCFLSGAVVTGILAVCWPDAG
ncbi:hypothetical protein [Roseateles chitosanitabidus]|uniref:hypothetical protein n=1 Tax=Roseateles chitosanitabidus TaxID=65048 RepID=UPI0011E03E78|nr:hypothetical protein [Roseateles chitosanitabidus]